MSNVYTTQILKDTNTHAIIKLTGTFDGVSGDEFDVERIKANTLNFALDSSKANLLSSTANTGPLDYYGLSVDRIWYASSQVDAALFWSNGSETANTIITVPAYSNGEYNGMGNWASIPNNAITEDGCIGDIGVVSKSAGANSSYTIIVSLRKDNSHYSRGQIEDPSAFNYGIYSIEPK
jgi:hypothetical protein